MVIREKLRWTTGLLALAMLVLGAQAAQGQGGAVSSGYLEVNGGKLYYEIAGEGPPLVFIAGGSGMDLREWDDQFQFFAKHFRVVRCDPRGIGKSDIPTQPFSFVEDLNSLLESLRIKKAHLVGLSFGGGIAIDFTLVHPEKVSALILVGPALGGYRFSEAFQKRNETIISTLKERGVSAFVQAALDDPYLIPSPANPAARQKAATLIAENTKVFSMDPKLVKGLEPPAMQRLSEIRAPTLVIEGNMDHPEAHEIVNIVVSGIRGARKVTIPQAGHTVNMENPQEFNRVVSEFLAGLPARDTSRAVPKVFWAGLKQE